jgi:predicted phage-related endonuclease
MITADRRAYVGGSDFGNILNIEPYGCRRLAWFQKTGQAPDTPVTGNMKRGIRGEDLAVEEYESITGRKVRRKATIRDGYQAGSIDRHIVAFDERGPGVLEVKCPSDWAFRRVKHDGLSQAYVCQLQWYMHLTGWKWGSYAIFNLDRWELIWWDVERDDTLIALLVASADSFWGEVTSGTMPETLDASDKRCKRCAMRPVCHNTETSTEPDTEFVKDESLAPLVAEYADVQQILRDAEALQDDLKERIKAAAGERQAIETSAGKLTHYWVNRKGYEVKPTKYRALRVIPR